jgi:hypothetical protein
MAALAWRRCMTAIGFHKSKLFPIDLTTDARRRHLYLIGATGVGKSNLMERLALADIRAGNGVCFIDPHGQSAQRIADNIPIERTEEACYLEYDPEHPFGLNILEDRSNKSLTVENIVSMFWSIWPNGMGPNNEDLIRNAIYLLLDTPGTSLADMLAVLSDPSYRASLLDRCTNEVVRQFWEMDFVRKKPDDLTSTTNKLRAFLSNPYLAEILRGPSTVNIAHLMNQAKILLLNLSKGTWGQVPSQLIGCLFVIAIAQAAEKRTSLPEQARRDFYLYVDEVENFQNDAFTSILSEARKMRLSLTLANQFFAQLPDKLRGAIAGNVATLVAFRIGAEDSGAVGRMLMHGTPANLQDTSNYDAWVRTLADGAPTDPVLMQTYPPEPENLNRLAAVTRRTRARHTRNKDLYPHSPHAG